MTACVVPWTSCLQTALGDHERSAARAVRDPWGRTTWDDIRVQDHNLGEASDRGGATLEDASCYPEVGVTHERGDPCVPQAWMKRERVEVEEKPRASLNSGRQIGGVGVAGAGRSWAGSAEGFVSGASGEMALVDRTCDEPLGGGGPYWAGRDCAARRRGAFRSWQRRLQLRGCRWGPVSWKKFARDFECFETKKKCRLHVAVAAVVAAAAVAAAADV